MAVGMCGGTFHEGGSCRRGVLCSACKLCLSLGRPWAARVQGTHPAAQQRAKGLPWGWSGLCIAGLVKPGYVLNHESPALWDDITNIALNNIMFTVCGIPFRTVYTRKDNGDWLQLTWIFRISRQGLQGESSSNYTQCHKEKTPVKSQREEHGEKNRNCIKKKKRTARKS